MTFWTRVVPALFLALLVLSPVVGAVQGKDWGSWSSAREEASRVDSREISLDGADLREIEVGAGFLKVYGEGSRNGIRMKAEITARSGDRRKAEEILGEVEILEDHRGSTLTLKTRGPQNLKGSGFQVDLTLWVPAETALKISDGSGDIEVLDMRNGLEVQDGSGDLEIRSLEGPLEISDGSGDIRIRDIDATGGGRGRDEIRIRDGSGNIDIEQVLGDMVIKDGSGNIEIREVTGATEVKDGSGNLEIRDVVGDVEISDGSGNIRVDNIGGNLRIENAGSGSLQIGEVSGSVVKPE